MKFSVFQLSRIGNRPNNEDRMGYCHTRESGLFALTDGMGGHPEGEVAAQLALEAIAALYQQEARPILPDTAQFLSNALIAAHLQITRYANQKAMLDTPRTTLVAVVLQGGSATWVHCGDSRLYLVRNGKLVTRTRDHSVVERRNAGGADVEHLNRNILFSCLGSTAKPLFDITGPVKLLQGDKLLLCSDGLWGTLTDAEIVRQLASKPVSDAVPELVERALRAASGNSDNVTVLAIEWEMPNSPESSRVVIADSMMNGEFASTIQTGLLDSATDELDEAGIERSIAEINAAIRRSAARKA